MASRGEVPADIVPFLCGATLIACLKKGGICPIAICESVRRLVSKCLVTATLPEAADCLSPHQLCVGVPGGAEGYHPCCEPPPHITYNACRGQAYPSFGLFF